MPGLNLKAAQWEQQHKTHVEEYLRQIEALYDVASDELIRLGMGYKYQPNTGRLFAFSSNKSRSKQADASLSSFRNKLSTIITAGITSEWFFANDKNDSITVSVHLDEWIIYIMCVLIKCFKTVTSMANTAQPPYSRQKKR